MPEGLRSAEPNGVKFRIKHAFIALVAISALVGSIHFGNKAVRTFEIPVDFCPVAGGYADEGMSASINSKVGTIEGGLQTSLILPEFLFPSFELSICKINGIDYLVNKFGKALELKITRNGLILAINSETVFNFDENTNPVFADIDLVKLKERIKTQGKDIYAIPEPKVMTPGELKKAQALSNISLIANLLLLASSIGLGITVGALAKNVNELKQELTKAMGSASDSTRNASDNSKALRSAREDNALLSKKLQDSQAAYRRQEKRLEEMTRNKNRGNYNESDN